jgi:hypothetical protein
VIRRCGNEMGKMTIREIWTLDDEQKRRVLHLVRDRDLACEECGAGDFEVGKALQLGRIWHNEEHGYYMVALRCENCRARTGIRLRDSEFLW